MGYFHQKKCVESQSLAIKYIGKEKLTKMLEMASQRRTDRVIFWRICESLAKVRKRILFALGEFSISSVNGHTYMPPPHTHTTQSIKEGET
jgi:hypothetical protein